MTKPRVILSPRGRSLAEVFDPADLARLRERFDVVWGRDEPLPKPAFDEALPGAFAVVFATWAWGHDAIRQAGPQLKAVLEISGGHGHDFDYGWCFGRGVHVGSCAWAFGPGVAEMALALTLDCTREVSIGDRDFREGREKWLLAGNVGTFLLFDKTVGFVGYGGLARNLQPLLAPFRVKVLAHDPYVPADQMRARGAEPASLETICSTCDVIYILAVPTPDNKGLVSRPLLERIRPGRVLVLVSRSHLVDFDALTELVLAGRFKAGIDVYPKEPLPLDHPIRQARGAVHSGHRAGTVTETMHAIGRAVVDDLELIAAGRPPAHMQYATPLHRQILGKTV